MSSTRAWPILRSSFASLLFLATTPLVRANDWYVDVNDPNCASGTGGPTAPFCTIGAAVSAAANGDTIHVAAGTYFEKLLLDKSLTLLGTSGAASTIVDGSSGGTVVTITAAAVVDLDGFTIQHGAAQAGGGLKIDPACDVTLSNGVVTDNLAFASYYVNSYGGGIYVLNATVTIHSSTIANNSAIYTGYGGGIHNDGGTVSLDDSVVSGNHTSSAGFSGAGAGISNTGTLHLARSKITANHDDSGSVFYSTGGGIWGGTIDGSEVEISGNDLAGSGGGIASASVTLTDAVIAGNTGCFGGGLYEVTGTLTSATIRDNSAVGDPAHYGFGGIGGGAYVDGKFAFADCLFENNTASGNSSTGGGAYFTDIGGPKTLDRCTFRGNVAGSGGGAWVSNNGLFNGTSIVLRDCAFFANSATTAGGLWCASPLGLQTIQFLRCTIGGNKAKGSGGGLSVDASSTGKVTIDHTIVAGNSAKGTGGAPDCDGLLFSNGYNCIGNMTGCTITGNNTGNLRGVDPLYADPANGDFTLQPISPCLDTGDHAAQPTGTDLAGHPRVLDGNLDRVMVVDMGAYEFDNVNLEISGNAAPGSTLTFDTTGTSGLPVLMLVGTAESELRLKPFGSLFIDLTAFWLPVPWGTIPNVQSGQIPPSIPVPVTLYFQELALDPPTRGGNLGNVVAITIE